MNPLRCRFECLRTESRNLNKLFTDLGGKFSAQDSDLEYLSRRRKNPPVSSDLKPPLVEKPTRKATFLDIEGF